MADTQSAGGRKHVPLVPDSSTMPEFTARALIIGLIMCVVLGAANAYLGLKAGLTIAATYPAAVIGMAALRIMKGSILEENFARTVGSIGESVAAGAIFTLPAFFIAGIWTDFYTPGHYVQSALIMLAGGVLGIMFVALLRRVMVEDAELPFPESVAASEIHKAGQKGATGAKFLFGAMVAGAVVKALEQFSIIATAWQKFIAFARVQIGLGASGTVEAQSGMVLFAPSLSPAYMGVGYIIGPRLAALNFTGGLLAWGLFVPILTYFIGPTLTAAAAPGTPPPDAVTMATNVWRFIVRPIAIGGMLISAAFTLFRMRKSLATGIGRSIGDVKKAATGEAATQRTEKDLGFVQVMVGILAAGALTFAIYNFFTGNLVSAFAATVVMIIAGFFFAAVSGYLVGIIGSSNNPISGLTLSTLLIAALLMVALGQTGQPGIAAVIGVAAVVCVSSAVAGEMLQDLKVGHILGGTPWKMEVGDLIGVAASAAVMFIPLVILHQGDINQGGTGLGGSSYPAPQASLMALMSQGIVGGQMAWPLVGVGMMLGLGMILMQVKSPMIVSVGMYIPWPTTFAIWIGGLIKGLVDTLAERRALNAAQKARTENTGVLLAAGLIAGEALVGLLFALFAVLNWPYGQWVEQFIGLKTLPYIVSILLFLAIAWILTKIPLDNAGSPDEPAPPSAVF
jgi:putative OPT family oligopeptide transporter